MAKGNKDAKHLKRTYGCPHETAVNLIRAYGLERATDIIAERAELGIYNKKEPHQPK